jgi:hypothetical protein
MFGSPDAESAGNTVESMIKPWIVGDFLRRLAENGQTPSNEVLDELTLVIVDSNDPLSESYYQQGGWGIIDGLPPELAAQVSIKNGYTSYMDGWHVNCLAIHHDWVLVVMMRSWSNLSGAADGCAYVARGLVVAKNPGD